VKVHPFVNGNGRHARLASDIFLFNHDCKLPNWPGKALLEASDIRDRYISALQAADKGNYQPLETFTTRLL
jgi:fido (protein-threonine AMPylation protein)